MSRIGLFLSLGVAAMLLACQPSSPYGRFDGVVQTEWSDDGRVMRLLSDFAYIDPENIEWEAKNGSEIDGASIPQVFWSFIGGPFEGEYRNASVVHDVACQKKERDWRAVHRMFYYASRCGGVGELRAKLMFAAVYHFGPRWGRNQQPETALHSEDDYDRLQLLIATEPDVEIAHIESLTQSTLQSRVPDLPPRVRPEELVLPHLRRALGSDVARKLQATGDSRIFNLSVRDEEEKRRIEPQLLEMRASLKASLERQERSLEAQILQEKDLGSRAVLASRLLTLSKEKAAIGRVSFLATVEPDAPQ